MNAPAISLPLPPLAPWAAVSWKRCEALANSDQALDLARLLAESAGPEATMQEWRETAGRAYLQKARELRLPPSAWALPALAPGASRARKRRAAPIGALLRLLCSGQSAPELEAALLEAGATPWVAEISPSSSSPWARELSADPEAILSLCFDRDSAQRLPVERLAARLYRALQSCAADQINRSGGPAFVAALANRYARMSAKIDPGSPGCLGPEDWLGKKIAQVILVCEGPLLAAERGFEPAAAPALLSEARSLYRFKSAALPEAVDPQLIRKSSSAETIRQARELSDLISLNPDNAPLIQAAFNDARSLTPGAACLLWPGNPGSWIQLPSVMESALMAGSDPALSALAELGANIWLASAQHSEPNACAWTLRRASRVPLSESAMADLARLLIDGAWITGRSDPVAHCVSLARAACEPDAQRFVIERANRLTAGLEREALSRCAPPPPSLSRPKNSL